MNTRMIIPALLSAVVLGTPVLAAGVCGTAKSHDERPARAAAMTPADQCTSLEAQFDAAIKTHGNAAKANKAKTMRADGAKLCASGKQAEGIAKLEQALRDLGVKARG